MFVLYFRSKGHPVATMCFNSNRPTVWEETSKIGFQDGGNGGHFGFPIGIILALFHLHVNLLLIVNFNLIRPVVYEMPKTDFQNSGCGGYGEHLGFPIDTVLAQFDPEVVLLLQSKFRLKLTKGLGKLIFNIVAVAVLAIFVSTRRPDAPHQVSTQFDHIRQSRCPKYEFSTVSHINV